ncbi:MAG TPA: hypothetical protein VK012_06895 [Gemmatimonadales bacterium]|nr:hypothetical protein [Gemmatimonadales bacterium]
MSGSLMLVFALLFQALVVVLPVALVAAGGWFLFRRSALGRSLLERLHQGPDQALLVQELAAHVAQLEEQVAELNERVDFTERRFVAAAPRSASLDRPRTPPEPLPAG